MLQSEIMLFQACTQRWGVCAHFASGIFLRLIIFPLGRYPAALLDPLNEQELRVLDLIVANKSSQEIAVELVISVGTASGICIIFFQKMGVNNRPQAIV